MNQKDNASPEEKLLRLIRQPAQKDTDKKQAPADANASKKKIAVGTSPAPSKKPEKKKDALAFSGITAFNFTAFNRFLLFFIFVAASLFVAALLVDDPSRRAAFVLPSTPPELALKERPARPFSYYDTVIAKRELFKSYTEERSARQAMPAGPTFRDLIKNLNLMGIVSGEKLQAIIEDRQLNKTYFLYQGDYLGEIKIDEIQPDKVILEYRGEQVNLFM